MTRRPRYSTYDDRKRLQFFSWFQRLRIILLVDWLIEDLMLHSRSRVQAVCIDPYMHGAAHWRPSQRKHEDKDLACKQTPDAVHSDLQTTAKDKASVHWQLRTHTHTHTSHRHHVKTASLSHFVGWRLQCIPSAAERLLWCQGLCAMNSASVIVWKEDCVDFIKAKGGTTDCLQTGREGQKCKDRLFTTF